MSELPHSKHHALVPQAEAGGPASDPARLADASLHRMHAHLWNAKEEPHEGFSLVPIFLIFVFAALIFWSGLYIANNSGGFRSDIYNNHWRLGESTGPAEDPLTVQLKLGKKIDLAQCKQCHGEEGKGTPGSFPPLAGSQWVAGNPARAIKILQLGMTGVVEVHGETVNASMPAIGERFKDKDTAAVLTYVRASFGNASPPVDEGVVGDVRASISGRKNTWSPEELLKEHPLEPMAPPAAAPDAAAAAPH